MNHAVAHIEITKHLFHLADPLVLYVSGGNSQILRLRKRLTGIITCAGRLLTLAWATCWTASPGPPGLTPPGVLVLRESQRAAGTFVLPYTVKGMDFTFTGLLTSAIKTLKNRNLKDVAYSLQETAFAMLCEATERALLLKNRKELIVCGGVARARDCARC